MNLRRRNLLVTGGAGFIGANFVLHWKDRHPADTVVVLDALTYAGNRMSLASLDGSPRYTFVQGDICDQPLVEQLLADHAINTVVHFAAESHVDRSISGPDAFVQTNVLGTHAILKACRKLWLDRKRLDTHRFHHVSTDEVYGSLGAADAAFTETTPYAPNSPYAASKAASDHLVRAYSHTYGLLTTTSNCSNNYGPFQFPEKLIPLMILNVLQGKELPIYGDGRHVRDWLHVRDHCMGIEGILAGGAPGATYNIGGNCERDNLSLVNTLCGVMDREFDSNPGLAERYPHAPRARGQPAASLIRFVKDRPGHDRRYAINASRIRSDIGFEPRMELEQGLADTVRWYLANESWWQSVLTGAYREWISTHYDRC